MMKFPGVLLLLILLIAPPLLADVLSGRVTRATDGEPVAGAEVTAYQFSFPSYPAVADTLTDEDGNYTLDLDSGSYRLGVVPIEMDLAGQFYDGVNCNLCSSFDGTTFSLNGDLTIDFGLVTAPAIQGRVTGEGGAPLVNIFVVLESESGNLRIARTDADGHYQAQRVKPDSYHVSANPEDHHVPQVHDQVSCAIDCFEALGTPVPLDYGQPPAVIDFQLQAGGVIEGTVLDSDSGFAAEPGAFFKCSVAVADANDRRSEQFCQANGTYSLPRLPVGDYFVYVSSPPEGYPAEAYLEVPCADTGCDFTAATPVTISATETITGIDFTLDPGPYISGTVTAAEDGTAVAGVVVGAVPENRSQSVRNTLTNADGSYRLGPVYAGSYKIRTGDDAGFHSLVHSDNQSGGVPCGTRCDLSLGDLVLVESDVAGVDFSMQRSGSIGGTIHIPGQYYGTVFTILYDDTGVEIARRSDITFLFSGLAAGTYYLSADNFHNHWLFQYKIFDGDATAGTPITLELLEHREIGEVYLPPPGILFDNGFEQ